MVLILLGVGKSIKELLTIFNILLFFIKE